MSCEMRVQDAQALESALLPKVRKSRGNIEALLEEAIALEVCTCANPCRALSDSPA